MASRTPFPLYLDQRFPALEVAPICLSGWHEGITRVSNSKTAAIDFMISICKCLRSPSFPLSHFLLSVPFTIKDCKDWILLAQQLLQEANRKCKKY